MKPHPTKSKPRKAYRTRPMGASAIPHSPEEEQRDEVNRERAKSRKPSPRQPGKGGRVMWRYDNIPENITENLDYAKQMAPEGKPFPVLVLDLSPEARERRVEAGAKASDLYFDSINCNHEAFNAGDHMRAILSALGDTPANEGRGK
jgi:hypothetical protein